jgi:hypothetical protein
MFTRNFFTFAGITEFNLMAFEFCRSTLWSRETVVSIVTTLQVGRSGARFPARERRFLSPLERLDRLREPTSLLLNGCGQSLPGCEAARA